jgi:MORN repeat
MLTGCSFGPRFVAAMFFCFVMIAAQYARAGEWTTDQTSGCQVWNPNPQLEESVTWSGTCTAGRAEGHGRVRWSRADSLIETDEGEWHDGRQVGPGRQIWSAGRYDGQIADGEPNGHGVLTLKRLRYEGEFRDGKPNGIGTLTDGSDSVRGNWKDGCLQNAQRRAAIGVPLSACR